MVRVMLGMAIFPVVWISDNASEMNQMLGIKHVTGAA